MIGATGLAVCLTGAGLAVVDGLLVAGAAAGLNTGAAGAAAGAGAELGLVLAAGAAGLAGAGLGPGLLSPGSDGRLGSLS